MKEEEEAPLVVSKATDCVHGVDILEACAECEELAEQLAMSVGVQDD